MTNSSPYLTYPGGKNGSGVHQQIINLMPPHHTYIEAFLGGGAILRAKRPAAVNIALDLDKNVIHEWGFIEHRGGIPNLTLIWMDALKFLRMWLEDNRLTADTLVYCDPPYLMSTRSTQRQLYTIEMAEEQQHRNLIALLRQLPCMVMLSGYWSELYADLLPDWRTHHFQAQTRSGKPATEWVWLNFPEPWQLHDYRFLGSNFRQRESIKRQKSRWLARLRQMSPLKRMALLDAIQSMSTSYPTPSPIQAISAEHAIPADAHRQPSPDQPVLQSALPITAIMDTGE